MSKPTSSFDLTNMLCGLAWLGELNREQIQRLWFVGRSESTVEKTLGRLRKDKLIDARAWSVRDTERNVTVPRLARWSLTPTGHRQLRACSEYPDRPMHPRQARLLAHDARTTETIVRLIEIARPYGLSGIYIRHEVQLDPRRPRPTCDALIVIHLGNGDVPNQVPWSHNQQIDTVRSYGFAIESDNATETSEMLRWKGSTYARLGADADWLHRWRERYGEPPLPIWVAPTAARAQQIHVCWRAVWPHGTWLIADDAGLADNHWLLWRHQQERAADIHFPDRPPAPAPAADPAYPETAQPATIEAIELPSETTHMLMPSLPDDGPPVQGAMIEPQEYAVLDSSALAPASPARVASLRGLVNAASQGDPCSGQIQPTRSQPAAPPAAPATVAPSTAGHAQAPRRPSDRTERTATPTEGSSERVRTAGAIAWFLLTLLPRGLVLLYRVAASTLDFIDDLWGYETRKAVVALALVFALGFGSWRVFGAYLGDLAAATAADRKETVAATAAAVAATTARTPSADQRHAYTCGTGRITASDVRLRAAPGLTGRPLRRLERREQVTVLCDARVNADGYVWQRVIGVHDVQPGWVAAKWLQRLP
jgi:hypothetical protein